MSADLYKTYALPVLAVLAADDIAKSYSDRSAPVDAAIEMAGRLRRAAAPLALPSESETVINTLRISTRGGMTASAEGMREYANLMADRLTMAVKGGAPADECKLLASFCMNVASTGSKAEQRMQPAAAGGLKPPAAA